MASNPRAAPALEKAGYISCREPPPERPSDIRRRSLIVLSFWSLVILLGLPLWWYTTAIHRANLPVGSMLQWADGKACRPVVPLRIAIRSDDLTVEESEHLLKLTQSTLDDLNDYTGHHLRLQPYTRNGADANMDIDQAALTVNLRPGQTAWAAMDPHQPIMDIVYEKSAVPSPSSASSELARMLASELRSAFAEEQAIISHMLSPTSESRAHAARSDIAEVIAKRTTRSLRYSPTYHLTFSLFTAGALPNTWDIESAINQYIAPMLNILRPIHNFTIDTQVQLYATPGVQSQTLSKPDLASFINAAEWPLSPSIGKAPTLNFVIFAGNQTVQLDSESATSQSWMVPQWGTVYVLPISGGASHVSSAALKQPMLTFGNHLLSLIGTPAAGSLPVRLSTLSRIRSVDLFVKASSTLGSLARLTQELSSISIPESVADGVLGSIHHLEAACSSLDGVKGLFHARMAEEAAEKAFFEKSMVGQLYFPDEHKVAVYLPLLGPIGVPILMGLFGELKRWRKERRQRAEDAKAKKGQ